MSGARAPGTIPVSLRDLHSPRASNPIHPGSNPGANLKSISHRCYSFEVAFVWELTEETIDLPLGCLHGGVCSERCVGERVARGYRQVAGLREGHAAYCRRGGGGGVRGHGGRRFGDIRLPADGAG